jgi:hypothetical protein
MQQSAPPELFETILYEKRLRRQLTYAEPPQGDECAEPEGYQ